MSNPAPTAQARSDRSTALEAPARPAQPPSAYRLFDLTLLQRIALSPSLVRLVFTGAEVGQMNTLAPDQRVKLLFPAADGSLPPLDPNLHWNEARRALPEAQRPPMRTYTIRALDRAARTVSVDFVLHGVSGPASAWATLAQPGDAVQMIAPNLAFVGDPGGYEWKPPQGLQRLLLAGDETALPAIAGILEQLAEQGSAAEVEAFVEVPLSADRLDLRLSANAQLHWLARDRLGCAQGAALREAVKTQAWLPVQPAAPDPVALEEVDVDRDILWEQANGASAAFHAWVAGESATVMDIRRHLITTCGLDRRCLSLMGYWRAGRVLD